MMRHLIGYPHHFIMGSCYVGQLTALQGMKFKHHQYAQENENEVLYWKTISARFNYAQLVKYKESIKRPVGKAVLWQGYVSKVNCNTRLCVRMDPQLNDGKYMDVEVLLPKTLQEALDKFDEEALECLTGQNIYFYGIITAVSDIFISVEFINAAIYDEAMKYLYNQILLLQADYLQNKDIGVLQNEQAQLLNKINTVYYVDQIPSLKEEIRSDSHGKQIIAKINQYKKILKLLELLRHQKTIQKIDQLKLKEIMTWEDFLLESDPHKYQRFCDQLKSFNIIFFVLFKKKKYTCIEDEQEVILKKCRYELANNVDCFLRLKAKIMNFVVDDAKKRFILELDVGDIKIVDFFLDEKSENDLIISTDSVQYVHDYSQKSRQQTDQLIGFINGNYEINQNTLKLTVE